MHRNMDAMSEFITALAERNGAAIMDVHGVSACTFAAALRRMCSSCCLFFQPAIAYEKAHNTMGLESGVLTNDKFHPCQTEGDPPCTPHSNGNLLIANALSDALFDALKRRRD